jgi:hypothetical protein
MDISHSAVWRLRQGLRDARACGKQSENLALRGRLEAMAIALT